MNMRLRDGNDVFDVTVLGSASPCRAVLFAVGGGGDPRRHLPLLTLLAEHGCTVVAPHFERLTSSHVTAEHLMLRARRLRLALDSHIAKHQPTVGVGHSIGATALLALAGSQVWLGPNRALPIEPDARIGKLALMAPATDFFRAPGALDDVQTPLLIWAASEDVITPPTQAEFLERTLGQRLPVEVRIAEGAGHFSFMNVPPPGVPEPFDDCDGFLEMVMDQVRRFVLQ